MAMVTDAALTACMVYIQRICIIQCRCPTLISHVCSKKLHIPNIQNIPIYQLLCILYCIVIDDRQRPTDPYTQYVLIMDFFVQ